MKKELIFILGGLGLSAFAVAKAANPKKRTDPAKPPALEPVTGVTIATADFTLPTGAKIIENQRLTAFQDRIPLVGTPGQTAPVLLTLDKGAFVGEFTGRTANDTRFFAEGLRFVEVRREGKFYWAAATHLTI